MLLEAVQIPPPLHRDCFIPRHAKDPHLISFAALPFPNPGRPAMPQRLTVAGDATFQLSKLQCSHVARRHSAIATRHNSSSPSGPPPQRALSWSVEASSPRDSQALADRGCVHWRRRGKGELGRLGQEGKWTEGYQAKGTKSLTILDVTRADVRIAFTASFNDEETSPSCLGRVRLSKKVGKTYGVLI